MLRELRIENLLLIERAEIVFGPGFNVITGETGAGKTVLAHALDLITGGRPKPGIVRPGADEAYVEGVFDVDPENAVDLELGDAAGNLPLQRSEITLSRKVSSSGRASSYAYGRSTSAENLKSLGSQLIGLFGQHEHRTLLMSSEQLKILDGFCGQGQVEAVRAFRKSFRRMMALRRDLVELSETASNREREIGILDFEIEEIEELTADLESADELIVRHRRLANLEALRSAALGAAELIEPDGDGLGAATNLATAAAELEKVSNVEESLYKAEGRCRELTCEAQEIASELRSFESLLEGDPEELSQLDQRVGSIERIYRKHGPNSETVLEKLAELKERRNRIDRADDELAELEKEIGLLDAEMLQVAGNLTRKRKSAAKKMSEQICAELSDLDMPAASFNIEIASSDSSGIGQGGLDAVEFRLSSNPGVKESQLREAASGGELSRVMLAILSAARSRAGWPTMVFDEIDAGIGGTTANLVGQKLKQISSSESGGRQVICITHLPQVAAHACKHFTITKETGSKVTTASVREIAGDEVVAEFCRMLGAEEFDTGARKHAQELLKAA